MSREKQLIGIRLLLLTASLLMTASCGLRHSPSGAPSPISLVQHALAGQSSETLTDAEIVEIQKAIRSTYPSFPPPTPEAIQALRNLNDPQVNLWLQNLAILCRQLEDDC